MQQFYNFDHFDLDNPRFPSRRYGMNYAKTINGIQYLLVSSFPYAWLKNATRIFCHVKNYFSYAEYLSCNILSMIGLNCQKTLLGDFQDPSNPNHRVLAVACENLELSSNEFFTFHGIVNAGYHVSNPLFTKRCDIDDVLATIAAQPLLPPKKLKEFFWKQFVGDAFIGNCNRTNDHWGILIDINDNVSICPLFDCASRLSCCISDRDLQDLENRETMLKTYCYETCKSAFEYHGKKIDYLEFISQNVDADCTKTFFELMECIDLNKILDFIENAPIKDESYKNFYKDLIVARKTLILDKAYREFSSPMVGV